LESITPLVYSIVGKNCRQFKKVKTYKLTYNGQANIHLVIFLHKKFIIFIDIFIKLESITPLVNFIVGINYWQFKEVKISSLTQVNIDWTSKHTFSNFSSKIFQNFC